MELIDYLVTAIGAVGIAVIVWGMAVGIVELVRLESHRFRGAQICKLREQTRHHMASYLLLGLEFMVAADIVRTIARPTLTELGLLGGLVAIRTVLSYFLGRELAEHNCAASLGKERAA